MTAPYTSEWIDECWGRIVIAIGRGDGKAELQMILDEAATERFTAGMKAEQENRSREIAEKLMGKKRLCAKCETVFEPSYLHGGTYLCGECEDDLPF